MVKVREFSEEDFSQVKLIYQHGIDTRNATFRLEPRIDSWRDVLLFERRNTIVDV